MTPYQKQVNDLTERIAELTLGRNRATENHRREWYQEQIDTCTKELLKLVTKS